ncbi:MAG TPA: hypothetical protein VMV19_07875 [Xanthobacteraceae bacterium]|nr:hypothetical protein [Xanthobacteraceae bacterium]
MTGLAPGEKILVPTEAQSGAFPGERLVTISTETGPISGFAKADFVIHQGEGTYLIAEVKRVFGNVVTVKLYGSFFTTTGLADISKSTAFRKMAG